MFSQNKKKIQADVYYFTAIRNKRKATLKKTPDQTRSKCTLPLNKKMD
jgi:hypothetical protein